MTLERLAAQFSVHSSRSLLNRFVEQFFAVRDLPRIGLCYMMLSDGNLRYNLPIMNSGRKKRMFFSAYGSIPERQDYIHITNKQPIT